MSDKQLEFIDVEAVGSPRSRAPTAVSSASEDSAGLLSSVASSVRRAKHPVAAFFHVLFKVLALAVYIFGSFVSNSFVFVFVVCILLLAFDFWTVKNVSGRLLVGLRWWNRMNEDGTSEWIFESHEDLREVDALDAKVFWTALYGVPCIWSLSLLIAVLKLNLEWALIAIVALTLSMANIVGYTKCSKDAKSKMKSMMAAGALEAFQSSAGSTFLSTLGDMAFAKPARPSAIHLNTIDEIELALHVHILLESFDIHMHHELFLALLGIPGDLIIEQNESFTLDENYVPSLLSSADRTSLLSLVPLGYAYKHLLSFTSSRPSSLYACALGHAISCLLRAYERRIASLEASVLHQRCIPIALLHVELSKELLMLPFVLTIVKQSVGLKGKDVLELVKGYENQGIPCLRETARSLLSALHRVLYRQMLAFMVAGNGVLDPNDEFFIAKSAGQWSVMLGRAPLKYLPATVCEDTLFIGSAMKTIRQANKNAALELQKAICALVQHDLAAQDVWDPFAVSSSIGKLRIAVAQVLYEQVIANANFVQALHRMKAFFLCGDGALLTAFIQATEKTMQRAPHFRSQADLKHTVWAPLLREYDDDDLGNQYAIDLMVPVQQFDFGQFAHVDCIGMKGNETSCLEAIEEVAYARWLHPQFVQASKMSFGVAFSIVCHDTFAVQSINLILEEALGLNEVVNPKWTPETGLAITCQGIALECRMESTSYQDTIATTSLSFKLYHNGGVIYKSPTSYDLPDQPNGQWILEMNFNLMLPTAQVPGFMITMTSSTSSKGIISIEMPTSSLPKIKDSMPFMPCLALSRGVLVHHWKFSTASINDPWRYLSLSLSSTSLYRHLLFPPSVLRGYTDVFRLLFRLKRALYALEHFDSLSEHSSYLLKGEMIFVLHNVLLYFHVSVVEAGFAKLLNEIATTKDFDRVQSCHVQFIATIGRKCFVHATAVMSALDKLIDSVWRFCNDPTQPTTFHEHARLLFTVLNQTNARELMAQLDFNGYVSSLINH
ncbi:hypothetical protein THRCLA_03518 [Thraustotheca clavata]|uniref:Spindle pole body component n=1 Tax=Thraustotheca clavata TaxID=74557 RepID=A0A1W0A213_9STRA|nr:hypothetical protein THRCLA_03518 [Thraustotheca clavata]